MNISRKPNRSTRVPPSVNNADREVAAAPIDTRYGVEGLGYFLPQERGSRSTSTGFIKSHTQPGRTYGIGRSTNLETSHTTVFVACLTEYGQLDKSFHADGIFDFNTIGDTRYAALNSIIEDRQGNLLVILSLDGESASQIWRLTASGEPDLSFGQGKGYVDTRGLIDEALVLERLAMVGQGIFVAGLRRGPEKFEPVIVAFDNDGRLRRDFGTDGILDGTQLIPDTSQHIIDGIAAFAPQAGTERLLVTLYLLRDDVIYSVAMALTTEGKFDTSFGDDGLYWSDDNVILYGLSVDVKAKRISFYGSIMPDEDGPEFPAIYRLDYAGKPAKEFNNGNMLVFERPGAWTSGMEDGSGLVGYGQFYTYTLAFRLTAAGTFDDTFVPPRGYGQYGARGDDGFYSSDAPPVYDAAHKRLLISGHMEATPGFNVPGVIAISMRPT